jgi:hypothetical protein
MDIHFKFIYFRLIINILKLFISYFYFLSQRMKTFKYQLLNSDPLTQNLRKTALQDNRQNLNNLDQVLYKNGNHNQ